MKAQDRIGLLGTLTGMAMIPALGSGGWDMWELASVGLVFGSGAGVLAWSNRHRLVEALTGEGFDEIRPARLDEADAIHSLAIESFGDAVTDRMTIASFIRKNQRIFWVFTDRSVDGTSSTIEGYGCILPINQRQQEEIETGKFGLASLTPANVPNSNEASAIYIGAVMGRRTRVKAKILGFMESQARLAAKKTRTKTVYAKAVTRDGLRTVIRRQFEPVMRDYRHLDSYFKKVIA